MKKIIYKGDGYQCRDDETLLDALQRQGVEVSFSCRNGICQVCMLRTASGSVPPDSQQGINLELQDKGYFFPCKCFPIDDMHIEEPRKSDIFIDAVIAEKTKLSGNIFKFRLEPVKNFTYRAGQFINVRHSDGAVRSYSLASTAGEDYLLELHIRHVPDGKVSGWLCEHAEVGDVIPIQEAEGECYYREDEPEKPLVLIGSGTGLAPLVGVVREAISVGREKDIYLYHGGCLEEELYLHTELSLLAKETPQFYYTACLSSELPFDTDILQGSVSDIALSSHPDLAGYSIYLAGSPEMVESTENTLRMKGVLQENIYSDPFTVAVQETSVASNDDQKKVGSPHKLPPDPELWKALEEGALMTRVLNDFYGQVFKDPRMSAFFHGVTQQRAVEKQYLFMRQLITGDKVYFGDRPRNSHHWMVISNELFDYRESLILDTLRRYGLSEHLVQRWRALEEQFRDDIVKDEPRKRMMGDIELPLDGYGETVLDVGSICDSCSSEIEVGVTVRYHLRLGSLYCPDCMVGDE